MIDSDLADSDLGTRGGVHLIESKRERTIRSRGGRERKGEGRKRENERWGARADSRAEVILVRAARKGRRIRQSKKREVTSAARGNPWNLLSVLGNGYRRAPSFRVGVRPNALKTP